MINRPGVEVQFSSLGGSTRALAAPTTYFVTGYAEWGPVNTPVFLADKRELLQTFGQPTGYGWLTRDLIHFFDTAGGAGRAWAVRGFEFGVDSAGGKAKTAADYTAKVTLSATAAPVLTVEGAYPGALGNRFRVDVIADTSGLKKVILWGRSTPTVITWSANEDRVRAQIARINALADANASDFRVSIPGAFSASGPDTTAQVRALFAPSPTALSLTGGGDGATTNFPLSQLIGGLDANDRAYGLEVLNDTQYGPGVVAIPGYTPTLALTEALNLHARLTYRLAAVSLLPSGDAVMRATDAVNLKRTLTQSSFVSYYYPQVYDLDGVLSPMEGYVAGIAARNQARIDAEGGVKASITGTLPITGVVRVGDREPVRDGEAELLYAEAVNYVRNVRGIGYRLESQLLSTAEGAISRIHHRMITLKFWYDLNEVLELFRDRTIDSGGKLQDDIRMALEGYLDPYQPEKFPPRGNTFYNSAIVVTDNSIQNSGDLEQGLLHVLVEGSFTPKSERISLLFNVKPVTIG